MVMELMTLLNQMEFDGHKAHWSVKGLTVAFSIGFFIGFIFGGLSIF
ncbi:MAG: hypothetical protein ABIH39_09100 [Candidatus Margulisiibacteriota bacterium]